MFSPCLQSFKGGDSMITTVSKKNKTITGTKSADYVTLLKGANNAKVKLNNGKDVLTATNVVGGNFNLGAGNDRAVISSGKNHVLYMGAGNDEVTSKNTQGDKFYLGSGNDKLTMSKAKNATLFYDGSGKKTITGADSSLKFDLQGATYQTRTTKKDFIVEVYGENRSVVATFNFKNSAKKNHPQLVNGCNGFAATDEITDEEYIPIGNIDTITSLTTPPITPGREVDVLEPPTNWHCDTPAVENIVDEVYTGLSNSSWNCGTPALDTIVDERYSWGYSISDLSSNSNLGHETSVVQPSQQQIYMVARETSVAQPPIMF